MVKLIKIKNNSGAIGTWVGQEIADQAYVDISERNTDWSKSTGVFNDVSAGNLVVNNGVDTTDDFTDTLKAWEWLVNAHEFPVSDIDGKKLAVHQSSKPKLETNQVYAIWTGSGDAVVGSVMWGGETLEYHLTPGTATIEKKLEFDPLFGRAWIHESYLKFQTGGVGDYIDGIVIARATPLQTSVNLDLEVASNIISFAAGGAGTGTHGWADADKIALIPRQFSKDGEWDYDGTNLTPNATNTGEYRIMDIDATAHKYGNKIPCFGDCHTYFSMTSDETTEIPNNYYLKIIAHNISNTTWDACVIIEMYREQTVE